MPLETITLFRDIAEIYGLPHVSSQIIATMDLIDEYFSNSSLKVHLRHDFLTETTDLEMNNIATNLK